MKDYHTTLLTEDRRIFPDCDKSFTWDSSFSEDLITVEKIKKNLASMKKGHAPRSYDDRLN